MRSNEEILLEEVRSEYSRQLASWTELTHKTHSFLQLNGLVLTVIFIGIGLQGSFGHPSIMLAISSGFIIVSIIVGTYAARSENVKEIKVELEEDREIDGNSTHVDCF